MKQFTLEQFINEFGTDKQKQALIDGKGNVNKRTLDSVKKEASRFYEKDSITVEGRGTKRVITCAKEKDVATEKDDGRASNGAWSISYTKNLDVVVVSVLEQGLEKSTAQTLANWALDFGVITEKMHDLLLSRHHEGLRETYVNDLKDNSIIKENEDRIVDDFVQTVKELTNQVAGTLKRMEKAGIIEYYPVFKGHIAETDETINLHEDVYKQVVALKRRLMERYDVSEWYLMTYKNSKKTVKFNEEYLEQLAFVEDENGKVLGLDYYYTTYAVILKARKKKIIAYLKKYNKEVIEQFKQDEQKFLAENEQQFHDKRKEHVIDNAQKKAEKFLEPKPFKIANEVFGGKPVVRTPTINDYEFDSDYYALYFDGLYANRIGQLQEYYGQTFK
ncbi:hypothetical protein [Niallia endozanthoxylica]|uniref:Uncharacterized protein n=1 Tax=Niallia endozanthoxylica TaxID=2036016 RepID=A0A5J5HES3_9BACI|nr:hypothetical protein [Niallia endozanthoxylica]KAA9017984.1 hypothetical protein F4V44_20385 [Niallia endozanthoxylica]